LIVVVGVYVTDLHDSRAISAKDGVDAVVAARRRNSSSSSISSTKAPSESTLSPEETQKGKIRDPNKVGRQKSKSKKDSTKGKSNEEPET
jgi:hypothetical protein